MARKKPPAKKPAAPKKPEVVRPQPILALNPQIRLRGLIDAHNAKVLQARKQQMQARKPPAPQGPKPVQAQAAQRQGNNTTCDIYYDPNVPPAEPDVASVACYLAARFQLGQEASEGDTDFQWTHFLLVNADVDIRDSYPNVPSHRVYVPDKNGTGFDVVFVELVNRGTPSAYKRAYLDRRSVTWPSDQL